jgi:C_GCAxxG_C_C family probable redox protein
MTLTEKAISLHLGGSSCSQAVFTVFAEGLGMDPRQAHRLSTGLGGGVGRTGNICGAISGGVLALSLIYGSDVGGDQDGKMKTYEAVKAFLDEMEKRRGSTQCRDLLGGADLWTEAGRAKVKDEGLGAKVCNPLIAEVVEYIEPLLPKEFRHG